MVIKYYKNENLLDQDQISKEYAFDKLDYFIEALFDENEVERSSIYISGKRTLDIFYIQTEDEMDKIISGNFKCRIKIMLGQYEENGFNKQQSIFFSQQKEKEYSIVFWNNKKGICVKEEYLNTKNEFSGGRRYVHNNMNELMYSFEYDALGKIFNCYSLKSGSNVGLNSIKDINVADYEYFN